jgi:hypothetical protein
MVAMTGAENRTAPTRRVFVAHRATGVRLVPEGWLDAWRPSGFREATPAEVLGWYEERGQDAPSEVLRCVAQIAALAAEAAALGDERPRALITLS